MLISFANASGNLYNRIGKLGLLVKALKSYQSSQYINMTDPVLGVVAQYLSEPDLQAEMGSNYLSILTNTDQTISSVIQQLAADTVNRIVFRAMPQLNQNLTNANILTSLQVVIQQMQQQGATVLAMTVGATPTPFVGTGNGMVTVSTRRPLDGLVLENAFAETVSATCTSDSYSGTATAGNEGFSITGTGNETDFFAFDWPLGSNASTNLNAIDGDQSNGSENLLTNSGFANFTNNVPNNWVLSVGVGGVNTFQENSITYGTSGSALRITGDGTTLTTIAQQFNNSGGTTATLSPQTQYSCNLFMRRDGTPAGAGTMVVELTDQFGTMINDQAGNPNSFSIDLTALTTLYAAYNVMFRTPSIMPNTQLIRFRQSVALSNSRSIYLDKCSIGVATQLGVSEPFFAVHSGSVPFQIGDIATVNVTNSRGSGGTLSSFQVLFSQLFPQMISNEILLPSSATPSLSDTALIS